MAWSDVEDVGRDSLNSAIVSRGDPFEYDSGRLAHRRGDHEEVSREEDQRKRVFQLNAPVLPFVSLVSAQQSSLK